MYLLTGKDIGIATSDAENVEECNACVRLYLGRSKIMFL